MAADLIFHGQFIDADNLDGETGLTVTVDVYRTTISDGTTSQVVTGGSCTETGGGIYRYRYASADLSLYHYVANMKTASADVAQKHVACIGMVVPGVAADADGVPAVNVTMQAGVAVAPADANGNVKTVLYSTQGAVTFGQVKIVADAPYEAALDISNSNANGYGERIQAEKIGQYVSGGSQGQYVYGGVTGVYRRGLVSNVEGIDSQSTRDAAKLAPSAGAPAAGSVDKHLDDLLTATAALPTGQDINDILAAGTVNSVAEGVSLATEAINVNTFDISALQAIADAMGLAPTGAPAAGSLLASVAGIEEDTDVMLPATLAALPAEVDAKLSGAHGAGAWGGAGAWPKPFVYTLTNTATGQTIAGALIEVYANIGMTALVDQGVTDAYGRVRFELPSGTYYFKRTKTGWDFTNPDTEVQA